MSENNNTWLCRNCNTLLSTDTNLCPKCGAERGDECENGEQQEVVVVENYTNSSEVKKNKYIFRESVLVYAGDITLILGIFLSLGALLIPNFVEVNYNNPTLLSIVAAVAVFLTTLVSWAILRTLAEVSRILREKDKKE
jgi:RNA polymerase subunit RPABC4/transcription elongation factor Spt4